MRLTAALLLTGAFVVLAGCATATSTHAPVCGLDAPMPDQAEVLPGASVWLTTRPLTEEWDTTVMIGSANAPVVKVSRENCDDCDTCVSDTGATCDICNLACDDCAELCTPCVQQVKVTIPAMSAGTWPVVVTNKHGQSSPGSITVLAVDTGASDP